MSLSSTSVKAASPPPSVLRARQLMSQLDGLIAGPVLHSHGRSHCDHTLEEASFDRAGALLERLLTIGIPSIANILETHDSLRISTSVRANNDIITSILSRIDCGNARQESADLYESAREIVVRSDGQSETCELAPFLPSVAGEDLIGGSPEKNSTISSSSEGEQGWSDEEVEAFEKFEAALEKKKIEDERLVAAHE
ncbi:hypothetical protein FOZ63_011032 [Perkinsus olseni]|uniref:Uncharacterized protein n=1 Tax=Perkinsus olseni TaxID=32597 RepID=A0A7J6SJ54_PEROL|nr:hypothetical protein FOZ63_011032 [Perkinsus olseni]KAF4732974.1 hypothetical protein FOZ62_015378 [Perkinsus olseni]